MADIFANTKDYSANDYGVDEVIFFLKDITDGCDDDDKFENRFLEMLLDGFVLTKLWVFVAVINESGDGLLISADNKIVIEQIIERHKHVKSVLDAEIDDSVIDLSDLILRGWVKTSTVKILLVLVEELLLESMPEVSKNGDSQGNVLLDLFIQFRFSVLASGVNCGGEDSDQEQ